MVLEVVSGSTKVAVVKRLNPKRQTTHSVLAGPETVGLRSYIYRSINFRFQVNSICCTKSLIFIIQRSIRWRGYVPRKRALHRSSDGGFRNWQNRCKPEKGGWRRLKFSINSSLDTGSCWFGNCLRGESDHVGNRTQATNNWCDSVTQYASHWCITRYCILTDGNSN